RSPRHRPWSASRPRCWASFRRPRPVGRERAAERGCPSRKALRPAQGAPRCGPFAERGFRACPWRCILWSEGRVARRSLARREERAIVAGAAQKKEEGAEARAEIG